MMCSRFSLAAMLTVLAVAGCAAPDAGGTNGGMNGANTNICPQIKQYSEAQLNAIQKGINALAQDSPLRSAMQDYEDLRDDARGCQAEVAHRN